MGAFNAELVVEALDWSFLPHLDLKGTIPEPSDEQVHRMNAGLRGALTVATGIEFDPDDNVAMARAFGNLTDDQLRKIESANIAAVAHVTGDSPSADQIAELPFRIKRSFINWLVRELNNPEGAATATKP